MSATQSRLLARRRGAAQERHFRAGHGGRHRPFLHSVPSLDAAVPDGLSPALRIAGTALHDGQSDRDTNRV